MVATCIIVPKNILSRICTDQFTIPKGTLMKLSGANIVFAGDGTGQPFGGITVEEKTIGDGVLTVGCAMEGVWDIDNVAAPATPANGTIVCMSGANMIRACVAGDLLTGAVVGKLEEIGAASSAGRTRLIGY